MMDPLPSIAKVFSYAVQQERKINNNDVIGNTLVDHKKKKIYKKDIRS